MPINAKCSHRSEMTSTSEERFFNRKYVSGRWDANIHSNVHINMLMFISYKVHLQSVTFNLPQIGTSNKI